MPAAQGGPRFDDLTRRWHDLAERRLAHFAELYHSGRWRLYYRTEQQFAARMLEVIRMAKIWALLAGREPPSVTVPISATATPPAPPATSAPSSAPRKRDGMRPAA